ncbi:RT0821/Lpp0805 family surface protein [Kaistia terrae]|jgi:surface antigen|uniref:RT0821/Lpp0805 family surface protein n=1 Tax=Kaistia terrae TaxID=537017 RepID=A0ABW0PWG6_9HYPH|nr:RT0821/Lpp0805 family surface protein [Kaistia terrae]MCX5579575.1 RT0821/Lpp0805 family surface protein [Kaistia terrae]
MIGRLGPIMLCAGLTGCGLTPGGPENEIDMTTTGSIAPAAPTAKRSVVEAVAPSDWEHIRLTASTFIPSSANGDIIDWTNPDTGSNGTLSPVRTAQNEPDGRNCRAFALTVSDVRGIRRYKGDACRATDGMWQLFEVVPEDSALL